MKKIALIALLAIALGGCDRGAPVTKDNWLEVRNDSSAGTTETGAKRPYVYCRHGWVLIMDSSYGSYFDLGENGKPIPCNRSPYAAPTSEKPIH